MKKYYLLTIVSLALSFTKVFAQFPDTDPQAWDLVWSEEFDYTSYNGVGTQSYTYQQAYKSTQGDASWGFDLWGLDGHTENVYYYQDGSNMEFHPSGNGDKCSCTYTTLVTKRENKTVDGKSYHYTSAQIFSPNNKGWKYGYFEVSLRLPDYKQIYIIDNGPYPLNEYRGTNLYGLSSSPWMFGGDENTTPWSELDLMENFDGYNTYTCNLNCTPQGHTGGHQPYYSAGAGTNFGYMGGERSVLFDGNFHTVGMEWTPKYVRFYLDHLLIKEIWQYVDILLPMGFIIGSNVNGYTDAPYVEPGVTELPYKFNLNYVKVWKLKMGGSSDCYIEGSAGLTNYDHTLKESITVPNNINSTTETSIPVGQDFTLRAVNGVTIMKNFTVPKGAAFSATASPLY